MNAPILALLQLIPGEAEAVPQLHQFAADHPGVTIVTPHYQNEPWRAAIDDEKTPGEMSRSSRVIGADWPTELLAKLEAIFFPPGVEGPPGGDQPDGPDG